MRAALLLAPLFFAACSTPEPAPAPVEPPPAPEPEPVKIEQPAEPAVADCVDLAFTDGAEGTYTISEGADSHVKHHFTVPEGKDVLILTATWPDATWEMDVATGIGGCPHSGTTHATITATGNARIFLPASQLSAETTTFTPGETWFLHLGAKGEHAVGDAEAYTMAGQACTIVKPEPAAPAVAPGHTEPKLKGGPAVNIREKAGVGKGPKAKGAKGN